MGAIVVGYVPKPEGHAALDRAVAEAQLRGAHLVVVNSNRGAHGHPEEQTREIEDALNEVRTRLDASGVDHEVRHFVRGLEPAEDLISIADEVSAELIVIGLRRRTPVGKLVLGSNAQRILLDASCPVLAVKA
ncbi:universal stress protein [Marmoricola endophyticus]|uniref:Universal stress protein n=1 Tax=Marmoricola endophyticus TaxID=2040280 RepID=A0A917BCW1_9ACTN|nr:universal stress protein [Marmoricola endophyticus]GGF32479.1 universal stress protein [Marmoricola endophyticus]